MRVAEFVMCIIYRVDRQDVEFLNTMVLKDPGQDVPRCLCQGLDPAAWCHSAEHAADGADPAGRWRRPMLQTKFDPAGTGRFFPAELAMANPKFRNSPVLVRLFAPLGDIPALPGETSDAPCDAWRGQPGDTGFIIAEEGLGDRSRWPEIARLNGVSAENPTASASASHCRGEEQGKRFRGGRTRWEDALPGRPMRSQAA